MRLNRFIATYSGQSRRKADTLIEQGKVIVNRKPANVGMQVDDNDIIFVDGRHLQAVQREPITVMLNKPEGFVCSRDGQGSPSVYDLLQKRLKHLNIAGRLDKDSSGLVVLTDDGQLLQELTHPSFNKEKTYIVTLEKPILAYDIKRLKEGVDIGDKQLSKMDVTRAANWRLQIILHEGRNRQIRRSFESIGHKVSSLHRTKLGPYDLGDLPEQQFKEL